MAKKKEILKQEKKRKKELKESLDLDHTSRSVIINFIVVFGVFIIFLVATNIITKLNAKPSYDSTREKATIQYKEILYGSVFNRPEETYYVLFYDFDDDNASYYDQLVESTEKKIYKLNLGNGFNKDIISDMGNYNANSIEELKINGTTIMKIVSGKNVHYYEGTLLDIKENIK